jgi:DNA polymerase III alpha subunit
VNATLEDLVGSIEVTCWADTYQQTAGIWVEGNILLVQGKVRARQDGVQVVCDEVELYQPREMQPSDDAPPTPGECRLRIAIAQTDDEKEDLARLQRILDAVKRYPGENKVLLSIARGASRINVEMPNISTGYCRELHDQLVELVSEDGLRLEA